MKNTMKRLRRAAWALLLSALMVIEPAAGSMVAYAVEITEEESAYVVESETDEAESIQEDSEDNASDDNDADHSDKTEEEDVNSGEDVESGESMESEEGAESEEDAESDETEDSVEEDVAEDSLQIPEDIELPTDEELEAWAQATGRVPNGYIDIDYEVEGLSKPIAASDKAFRTAAVVPKNYDAREYGKVSSVKNQGNWGTCWSFSAVAAAESAYKMQHGGDEIDLSESQLVYFLYNGNSGIDLAGPDGGLSGDKTTALGETPVQRGGNSFYTTFALANWKGVVDEATDPSLKYPNEAYTESTNDLSIDSKYAYTDAMHLENAYWIPLSDKDSVKKAVMEYGTVGVSYYYYAAYDSDTYKRYVNRSYNGPAVYYNPQ